MALRPSNAIHVIQGEFAVSDQEEKYLTTVLGSCVATCMYDLTSRVGGMNHFLLPGDINSNNGTSSYGLNAMELLINNLLKLGARRRNLQAKIFGGARMMEGLSDIGNANAKFAREFLAYEGIPCISENLGGMSARRIKFWPATGRVQLKLMGSANEVVPNTMRETIKPKAPPPSASSDMELF